MLFNNISWFFQVNSLLKPSMKGVVVETFGSGNVPSNRPDLLEAFKAARERGVILINITQCMKGTVRDAYEAGRVRKLSTHLRFLHKYYAFLVCLIRINGLWCQNSD